MKRKMVWFGIPWLAGLFLATACQTSVTVSLLLAAFLLLGAFRLYRRITTGQLLCVGLSAAAAVGAVLLYTTAVYQPLLRSAGTITTFSGRVFAAKVYDNDRVSYQVKGTFADGRRAKILVYTDDVGARYGDMLDVAGGFSALENSYLWNRESYYRAKGIFLQANNDAFVSCTPTENGKLVRALQQYRDRISVRICTLAGTEAGGMVSAMLLGTKDTLADETNDLLTHHGIRHVVSVSGLHLVLILSIWGWFCRRFHMHRWAVFGTTTVWTILYALMVGTPISILRAGFMYLLMQSAPLFFRRADDDREPISDTGRIFFAVLCRNLWHWRVRSVADQTPAEKRAGMERAPAACHSDQRFRLRVSGDDPLFSGSVCGIAHCKSVFGTHLFRDAGIVAVDFSHRRCGICGETSLLSAEASV